MFLFFLLKCINLIFMLLQKQKSNVSHFFSKKKHQWTNVLDFYRDTIKEHEIMFMKFCKNHKQISIILPKAKAIVQNFSCRKLQGTNVHILLNKSIW